MKKILLVVGLLLLGVGLASSQTVNKYRTGDYVSQPVDVYQISSWSPFTSDSLGTVHSATFDIAQYDSLAFWVKSTSALGTPKFWGYVFGSFDGSVFDDSTSIGKAIDTAKAKLEVLSYCTTLPTHGALKAYLSLTGSSVATANRKDPVVTVYMIGHKRTSYR